MADFSVKESLSSHSHTSEEEEGVDEEEFETLPESEELETKAASPVVVTTSPITAPRSARRSSSRSTNVSPLSSPPDQPSSSRKPRGRPPGSKNKPKPPIYITKETEPSIRTQRLEIPAGYDIVEMIQRFSRKHRVGVHVINGTGSVSNFALRNPAIALTGAFNLLSLSGTFMGSSVCSESSSAFVPGMPHSWLAIFVGGNQGEVFGGTVLGQVIAATNVILNVTTFGNYSFHRIDPSVFDEDDDNDAEREKSKGRSAGKQSSFSPGAGTSAMGAIGYTVPAEHLNWAGPSNAPQPPPKNPF